MNTLVDLRNKENLNQREMAKKIGITLTLYSKIEIGERNPSYAFLVKFKKAFKNISVDELFFTS